MIALVLMIVGGWFLASLALGAAWVALRSLLGERADDGKGESRNRGRSESNPPGRPIPTYPAGYHEGPRSHQQSLGDPATERRSPSAGSDPSLRLGRPGSDVNPAGDLEADRLEAEPTKHAGYV